MAIVAKCIISRSEKGAPAYGVRVDNDENVFFPLSVADATELEEFEEVTAILVKNDRPDQPWKAIRVKSE